MYRDRGSSGQGWYAIAWSEQSTHVAAGRLPAVRFWTSFCGGWYAICYLIRDPYSPPDHQIIGMRDKKRVRNNTYAESENRRRPGALVEVALKSRKKRKQGAHKKIDEADVAPVFDEPLEDGLPYASTTSNSQVNGLLQNALPQTLIP